MRWLSNANMALARSCTLQWKLTGWTLLGSRTRLRCQATIGGSSEEIMLDLAGRQLFGR
ncbi:MAG: hypothetical protein Q8R44_04745 [Novosphingobium sp.]|nr:hypothetical protein [Novosphingobium sp.]